MSKSMKITANIEDLNYFTMILELKQVKNKNGMVIWSL